MTLYDPLIHDIEYQGKKIELCLSWNRVLECLDMLEDERFTPMQRVEYCLERLCIGKYPVEEQLLVQIFKAIFPKKKKKNHEKYMDYTQDRGLIIAAFWQTYGINLTNQIDKLHWQTFLDLVQGLPSNTRLAEVINIRARPMPKPTKYNAEERKELARLKEEVKLDISAKEKEENLQDGLKKIAAFLIQTAKRGDLKRQTEK